jgi:hypothetical protein
MRRNPALTSAVIHPPRRTRCPHRPLAAAALAALGLALTACGTEKADAGGPRSTPSGTASDTAQARPGTAEIQSRIEQRCPPSGPAEAPAAGPSAKTLPSGSAETLPGDAVEPIAPTSRPEVELNARDWCASALHEEHIAQGLWKLADPTPVKVRRILNDLGYPDDRIHGLKQSGPATRFFLDLRDRGGRLCLDGSAAGEETLVDKCVAPATGPFTPPAREEEASDSR